MTAKSTPNRWWLIDGALLNQAPEHSDALREVTSAATLYADLGEEAARLGPLLVSANDSTSKIIQQWKKTQPTACFGCNLLHTSANNAQLVQHFHAIRYVRPARNITKRFFLRYADNRALAALVPTLNDKQRAKLLGPITHWQWHDLTDKQHGLKHDASELPATSLLTLRRNQFKAMADQARLGDLLVTTQQNFPAINEKPLVEQHQHLQQVNKWCQERAITGMDHQSVILGAVITHGDQFIRHHPFQEAVEHAREINDPMHLIDWVNTPLTKGPIV